MIACPNCSGNLKFDIATQKMSCAFCNSSFDPYEFDDKNKDAEEQKNYDVTIFTCPQCGGELYSTDNAAAAFCSFCGASTILFQRIAKEQKPDYIIPFKVTKEDCKKRYMNKVKKALFLPKAFKEEKCIDSFRGIYMPYWSYDVKQQGPISVDAETSERKGDYVYHNHYKLTGDMDSFYHGITYDASSSFADNISERLAPYNVKQKTTFTPGYLSGFYADTADVGSGLYEQDAEDFAFKYSLAEMKKSFSKYSVSAKTAPGHLHTELRNTDNTMFPVWFMSYRNKDRVAYAAVNGQTGRVVADLPIEPKRYLLGSLILAVPLFLILNLIISMRAKSMLVAAMVLAIATMVIYIMNLVKINQRMNFKDDKGLLSKKPKRVNRRKQPEGPAAKMAAAMADGATEAIKTAQAAQAAKAAQQAQAAKATQQARTAQAQGVASQTGETRKAYGVGLLVLGISFGIAFLIRAYSPVADAWYYGTAIFLIAAICFAFIYVMKCYNVMATRRLPQFDKKGGDDRA